MHGGYYDQSHLNNYFKKTTGLTPRQYKLDHHLLAVNFIQLAPKVHNCRFFPISPFPR